VVFVHGLTGDARETWTYRGKKGQNKGKVVFWPRDCLKDEKFPLRVLTFGYDANVAHWFASAGRAGLQENAKSLLQELENDRSDSSESVSALNIQLQQAKTRVLLNW